MDAGFRQRECSGSLVGSRCLPVAAIFCCLLAVSIARASDDPKPSPLFNRSLQISVDRLAQSPAPAIKQTPARQPLAANATPIAAPRASDTIAVCIYELVCANIPTQDLEAQFNLHIGDRRYLGACSTGMDCPDTVAGTLDSLCLIWVFAVCDTTSVELMPLVVGSCDCDSLATMPGSPTCGDASCPGISTCGETCSPSPTCTDYGTCGSLVTCPGYPTCAGTPSCSGPTCEDVATCFRATCPPNATCPGVTTCEGETCPGLSDQVCIYQLVCATLTDDALETWYSLHIGDRRIFGPCSTTACVPALTTRTNGLDSTCMWWSLVGCDTSSLPEIGFSEVVCTCDTLPTMPGSPTCAGMQTCTDFYTCDGSPTCPGSGPTMCEGGFTCSVNPTCGTEPTCGNPATCWPAPSCVGYQTCGQNTCAPIATCQGVTTCWSETCYPNASCPGSATCGEVTCSDEPTCGGATCEPYVTCEGAVTCDPNPTCPAGTTCGGYTCDGSPSCFGTPSCMGGQTCDNATCVPNATCFAGYPTCEGTTCNGIPTCAPLVTCVSATTCIQPTCPPNSTCPGVTTCSSIMTCPGMPTCNEATCPDVATCGFETCEPSTCPGWWTCSSGATCPSETTCPGLPTCESETCTLIECDSTAARITIGIHQNPVLPSYIHIYVAMDEPLTNSPIVTIGNDTLWMSLIPDLAIDAPVYRTDYELTGEGVLTLRVHVTDRADNISDTTESFVSYPVGSPSGSFRSIDGRFQISVPSDAAIDGQYLLLFERVDPEGRIYELLPEELLLAHDARIRFACHGLDDSGTPAEEYAIFRQDAPGMWTQLTTYIENETDDLIAYTGRLGQFQIRATGYAAAVPVPRTVALAQNYPNPFNAGTVIAFTLGEPRHVTLDVYNILGERVARLLDEAQGVGTHEVTWDGTMTDGRRAPSGLYFYRLAAGGELETRKMLLIK